MLLFLVFEKIKALHGLNSEIIPKFGLSKKKQAEIFFQAN